MYTWKHYQVVDSFEAAFRTLQSATGTTHLVAGGTDYLLELQQGQHSPVDTLLDITRIPELTCLEVRGEELFIGAAVPVSQVAESDLVRRHAQAVTEACGLIGGPQVRNSATLGGNVAHALPAADGMISLVALDAQVEIASPDGLRRAPILSLFAGPGKSTLLPDREILVGFYLPLIHSGQASAFARVMRPQGVALPILNLAVWLESAPGDQIADVHIAVGPSGPVPQRACRVEDSLRGAVYGPEVIARAEAAWQSSLRFRSSARRASAAYRQHLSSGLFEQVLSTAWERACASREEK